MANNKNMIQKSASLHIFGRPPKVQLVLIEVLEQYLWEIILKLI